jgi:hypothetical protein
MDINQEFFNGPSVQNSLCGVCLMKALQLSLDFSKAFLISDCTTQS